MNALAKTTKRSILFLLLSNLLANFVSTLPWIGYERAGFIAFMFASVLSLQLGVSALRKLRYTFYLPLQVLLLMIVEGLVFSYLLNSYMDLALGLLWIIFESFACLLAGFFVVVLNIPFLRFVFSADSTEYSLSKGRKIGRILFFQASSIGVSLVLTFCFSWTLTSELVWGNNAFALRYGNIQLWMISSAFLFILYFIVGLLISRNQHTTI